MILTDKAILAALDAGAIEIQPFTPANLGTNSYDVTLGHYIGEYDLSECNGVIDLRKPAPPLIITEIPAEGMVLYPNRLYLGVTNERTYTPYHVPTMHGKSSLARIGFVPHVEAGFGDAGFNGTWTLEITVQHPTRVYAGMAVAQLCFHEVVGEIGVSYDRKPTAKYTAQSDLPVASLFFRNFDNETQPTDGAAV